jgi:hypothetical protein
MPVISTEQPPTFFSSLFANFAASFLEYFHFVLLYKKKFNTADISSSINTFSTLVTLRPPRKIDVSTTVHMKVTVY